MITCANCQCYIEPTMSFCPHCGTPLRQPNQSPPVPPNDQHQTCEKDIPPSNHQHGWEPTGAAQNGPQTDWRHGEKTATASMNNAVFALAYLPVLFWVPLVFDQTKSEYGRKVSNQGLLLLLTILGSDFIFSIVRSVILFLDHTIFSHLSLISLPFPFFLSLLETMMMIAILSCVIIGMLKGFQKQYFEIPIIGEINLIN